MHTSTLEVLQHSNFSLSARAAADFEGTESWSGLRGHIRHTSRLTQI